MYFNNLLMSCQFKFQIEMRAFVFLLLLPALMATVSIWDRKIPLMSSEKTETSLGNKKKSHIYIYMYTFGKSSLNQTLLSIKSFINTVFTLCIHIYYIYWIWILILNQQHSRHSCISKKLKNKVGSTCTNDLDIAQKLSVNENRAEHLGSVVLQCSSQVLPDHSH